MKSALRFVVVLCLGFFLVAVTNAKDTLPSGCTINNVQIKKPHFTYVGEYARFTAILNHSCKGAVGVKLKWTGYYADGSIAFTNSLWPNSISNIPPNVDFPAEFMHGTKVPPKEYTLTVSDVYTW